MGQQVGGWWRNFSVCRHGHWQMLRFQFRIERYSCFWIQAERVSRRTHATIHRGKTYCKYLISLSDSPLVKTIGNGYQNGLQVTLQSDPVDYLFTEALYDGYKILVHHPGEFPVVNEYGFALGLGAMSIYSVGIIGGYLIVLILIVLIVFNF